MQSNGGVIRAESALEQPVKTLFSGPVGGTIGGQALSKVIKRPNLICVDGRSANSCMINFYIDFKFKSGFFQTAISAVFNKAVNRMIFAFEKRADTLYGLK